ncbi:hypothetical protein ES707_15603 [subsurface metagenome]
MTVEVGMLPVGLAELQILLLADFRAGDGAVTVLERRRDSHDLGIEGRDALRRSERHVEFDIGNADRNRSEARFVRLIDTHPVAPGAGRRDMVVVLAIAKGGAFQFGRHRCKPGEQGLAAGNDEGRMPAQHLRLAAGQMELAAADIHPHVAVGHHQIGIARQPEARDVKEGGQALVRHLHVDVLKMDGIAEVFGGAVEGLLHDAGP